MLVVAASLLLVALAGETPLQNPDFEARAKGAESVPGWELSLGATNGAEKPLSSVELDREEHKGGRQSLHLFGDANTRGWQIVKQAIEVRPGAKYTLEAMVQTEGIRPNGFELNNCYVGLIFFDAADKFVAKDFQFPEPDQSWRKLRAQVEAPASARSAQVTIFLSMIGDLWVDDLQLEIEGGEELRQLERVLFEDFERARRVPAPWKRIEGATNGTGGEDSQAEVDPAEGALKLGGSAQTMRWSMLAADLKAQSGELYEFTARVKAREVRREGPQFENLHLSLAFLDAKGQVIEKARFAEAGAGSFDWKPLAVEAVSPLGTRSVRAGLFLSMSGEAWFDDLELKRLEDVPVPYGDWQTLEGKGVRLRFSASHPNAKQMKQYLLRLGDSKVYVCRSLGVEFEEPITVMIYKDLDEGRELTGGTLDFADPAGRTVHQRLNSYISHEMTHVIAHTQLGYGRTGLLGEGLAVWLDGRSPSAHHELAWSLMHKDELPSLQALLADFRAESAGYPAAGSFCGYLLETFGLETFVQLYPLEDPSAKAKELVGKSFLEMESQWRESLKKYRSR